MLGAPALSLCRGQQRGCELLSDLLEDSTTDDKHTSERRWDVSALDDITRYTKGSPERTPPSCERSSISPEVGVTYNHRLPRLTSSLTLTIRSLEVTP